MCAVRGAVAPAAALMSGRQLKQVRAEAAHSALDTQAVTCATHLPVKVSQFWQSMSIESGSGELGML